MQRLNRLKVLDCIRMKGVVARPEIAAETGLSLSSITNITKYLLKENLITETGRTETGAVGRKAVLLKLNHDAMSIISIDIGSPDINIAITNLDGDILKNREIPLDREAGHQKVLDIINKAAAAMLKSHKGGKVVAVGVALSGIVEGDEKLILSSSLKWKKVEIRKHFEEAFGIPTFVQNSSKTKALYELNKAISGKGTETEKNIIFLDLAMGVGAINIFEYKLNEAVVGEFGHTTVSKNGPACFCGNNGCLEVMCSVESITEQCNKLMDKGKCTVLSRIVAGRAGKGVGYDDILKAYKEGDKDVARILAECGEYLGIGIANITNIFNPGKIIINGDVLLKSGFIYDTALKEAEKRSNKLFTQDIRYEQVNIGTRESIKGLAQYVAGKLFDLSGIMI